MEVTINDLVAQSPVLGTTEAYLSLCSRDVSTSPLTFLAPWDRAWDAWEAAAAAAAPDLTSDRWRAHLCNLMDYHVHHGEIPPSSVATTPIPILMANGEVVQLSSAPRGQRFRANNVKWLATAQASNGYAYIIKDLLFPSWTSTTLAELLGTTNLPTYVSLLETAALADRMFDPNIICTVLPPSEQAFANLGDEYLDYLQFSADGLADLFRILSYHIIPGEPYPTSLLRVIATEFTTLEGSPIFAISSGTPQVLYIYTGQYIHDNVEHPSQAVVIQSDLLSNHGIVHILDSVLLIPGLSRYPENVIPLVPAMTPTRAPTDNIYVMSEAEYQQCRIHMLVTDTNRNEVLSLDEFVQYLNRFVEAMNISWYSPDVIPHVFLNLYNDNAGGSSNSTTTSDSGVSILGARPGSSIVNEEFLREFCTDTYRAVEAWQRGVGG